MVKSLVYLIIRDSQAHKFFIVTRPLPRTSDAAGESLTALPAKAGEERAIVEAAIEVE
jgi:hypothetical protein